MSANIKSDMSEFWTESALLMVFAFGFDLGKYYHHRLMGILVGKGQFIQFSRRSLLLSRNLLIWVDHKKTLAVYPSESLLCKKPMKQHDMYSASSMFYIFQYRSQPQRKFLCPVISWIWSLSWDIFNRLNKLVNLMSIFLVLKTYPHIQHKKTSVLFQLCVKW